MSKMHYFSNKFSKIALRPQRPLTFNIDCLKFCDLAKFIVFPADYDEIELQKYSYDVISVTSAPLLHRKTSPK